jgi:hypothetical protein
MEEITLALVSIGEKKLSCPFFITNGDSLSAVNEKLKRKLHRILRRFSAKVLESPSYNVICGLYP